MLINKVDELLEKGYLNDRNYKITFVNSFYKTLNNNAEWKSEYKKLKPNGGFYLDRPIRKILKDTYLEVKKDYPVIVFVSDTPERAIIDKGFSDLEFCFPESDKFYFLGVKEC